MIEVLKNQFDYVYGYIVWQVVNASGQFEENGEHIYIQDLWIHPSKRRGKALKHLIKKIDSHPFAWNVKYVYWNNLKHDDRITKLMLRNRLAKIGEKDGKKEDFSSTPCTVTN